MCDNVIIIDGIPEKESSDKQLELSMLNFLNKKFGHLKRFTGRDIYGVERFGRLGGKRPRPIRLTMYSEWHKRSIMSERKVFKKSGIFFNEGLSCEMRDINDKTRNAFKSNQLPTGHGFHSNR